MALKDKLPDGSLDEKDGREAEKTVMYAGEEIVPPSSTHVDSKLENLEPSSDVPTSPPPLLPPPSPPAIDGPLFPELDQAANAAPKSSTRAQVLAGTGNVSTQVLGVQAELPAF